MRNFTAFLKNKTPLLVKQGKKLTALAYDIDEINIRLTALKQAYNNVEKDCINQASQYNTDQEIQDSKLKAVKWNTTPAHLTNK